MLSPIKNGGSHLFLWFSYGFPLKKGGSFHRYSPGTERHAQPHVLRGLRARCGQRCAKARLGLGFAAMDGGFEPWKQLLKRFFH